jgi:hypothetical protein
MKNKLAVFLISIFVLTVISCSENKTGSNVNSQSGTTVNVGGAETPTDAYKMLYEAVKAKQTAAIKKMMSQKTVGFAEGVAGQQKKPIEAVYENGFTATTFAAALPQIRDERVKDNMGAIEVWNEKDKKWEDLPFIREDDGWKLAIGDIFAGSYVKPAKGQSQIEDEASNVNKMIPFGNNANTAQPSNAMAPPPIKKPLQRPMPEAPPQNSQPQNSKP